MGGRGSKSASSKVTRKYRAPSELSDNVEYREVQLLDQPLSEQEIIDKVGDKDYTGACASLALAYAANKAGLDVLDFRGGKSREYFRDHYLELLKQAGADVMEERDAFDLKAVNRLYMKMENDKEYILVTGRHAAVVRHTDAGYQYLELQRAAGTNGWQHLGLDALYRRFSAQKSAHTRQTWDFEKDKLGRTRVNALSYLVSVDSLQNNSAFRTLVGYINTASDQQKKG